MKTNITDEYQESLPSTILVNTIKINTIRDLNENDIINKSN